jgi:cation transport regulator ChaC
MKYFAYGSNCNPAVMNRKGVSFTSRRQAVLRGFRLLFNKKAMRRSLPDGIGFANINEDAGGAVEGILYEIVDDDLEKLDRSERYPDHYDRIDVTVESDSGRHRCCTYRAQPDKVCAGLKPSRNYLNHILAAGDFLSRQYYEALDKSQAYEGDCFCCSKSTEVVFIKEDDRLYMLCQSCREARLMWGDVRGRPFTVVETEAVMKNLVLGGKGFSSMNDLISEAIAARIIDP